MIEWNITWYPQEDGRTKKFGYFENGGKKGPCPGSWVESRMIINWPFLDNGVFIFQWKAPLVVACDLHQCFPVSYLLLKLMKNPII